MQFSIIYCFICNRGRSTASRQRHAMSGVRKRIDKAKDESTKALRQALTAEAQVTEPWCRVVSCRVNNRIDV